MMLQSRGVKGRVWVHLLEKHLFELHLLNYSEENTGEENECCRNENAAMDVWCNKEG